MEIRIIVIFLLSLSLYAIQLDSAIKIMDRRGLEVHSFQDKDEGKVIVARESVPINAENGLDDALAIAKARCEEKIAGLQSSRTYTGEQILNMEGDSLDVTQKRIEAVHGQKLRVELYSRRREGNVLHVVCYTSDKLNAETAPKKGKTVQETGTTAQGGQKDAAEYTEIKVVGMASMEGGRQKARELALHKARQDAIKQVLGTSLAGSTVLKESSKKNVDETGNEKFSYNEQARSKLYTSAMGFAEIVKVLEEGEQDGLYAVTVLARVYKDRLEEDYSPALKQLGDPGFYVESEGAQSEAAQTYFKTRLHDLGFRMSPSSYDADYMLRVKVKFIPASGKQMPSISLTMVQKSTGDSLLNIQNDLKALAVVFSGDAQMETMVVQAAEQMERLFHQKLNDAIGRMNANGRRFMVRLEGTTQFNRKEVDTVQEIINHLGAIDNLNVKSNPTAQVTDFTFEYSGDSHDLSRSLEKAFEEAIKKKKNRPKLKGVERNRLVFYF